ncbi:MAG TPA: hypothetical protein VG406_01055 [Isosphaeraceae bacterium]|jgi:hypothetical protein|nr:hypothetical protein [Isosphaeraceae bacterium]
MFDRNSFHRAIRVVAALAVLTAVMTSPIRPAVTGSAPIVPNYLRRNFAVPPTLSKRVCMPSQALQAAPLKAVRSEGEEEPLGRASCPTWALSGPILSATLRPTVRDPIGPCQSPSSQPLRC